MNRINTSALVVTILFIVVFIASIQILQYSIFKGAYFPIDDAYIYYQQAKNLIRGEFFSFSYGGESTNSDTSVLYYLISTLIMYLSQTFSTNLDEILQNIVYISVVFNIFYAFFSVVLYQKLINLFDISKDQRMWLMLSVFTTAPVVFAYVSGLETGLTIVIILTQLVLLLNQKMALFTLVSVIASIHRPENIIVNLAYVAIIIPFLLNNIDIKVKAKVAVIIFISTMSIPLLNYLLTGDYRSASAARTEFVGFINIFYNLFHFFSAGFSNPGGVEPYFQNIFKYFRYIIGFIVVTPLFFIFIKKCKGHYVNFDSFQGCFKFIQLHPKKLILFIVVSSYLLAPLFIGGGSGEWARYLSPTLPIFYLILAKILNYQRNALISVIFINILLIVLYINSYLNMTSIYTSVLHPAAKQIEFLAKKDDIVAIDSAGFLSHYIKGEVVDVYGLGTNRYMKVHGDFKEVYKLLNADKFNYVITWLSKKPKYYLDSAHYFQALKGVNIEEVYRVKVEAFSYLEEFPEAMVIYRITPQ